MIYLKKSVLFLPDERPQRLDEIRKQYRLRRVDRYTLMLLAAAIEATGGTAPPPETGLLVTSILGPHNTTRLFLDDLLDYPEDQVLSSTFSHSVHNAGASYLASHFALRGPALSLAGFENVYASGLTAAQCFLASGNCPQVLLLCAEEHGAMTEYLAAAGIVLPREFCAAYVLTAEPEPGAQCLPAFPDTPEALPEFTRNLSKEFVS